uniref:auxin-induced protein 15A-like n=1 Tax=Erigeron canadensis TaxID=72917 RepID=UPI001CB9BBC0|nr:auxin-induced protein 15A-like [Erigeron canadensis]
MMHVKIVKAWLKKKRHTNGIVPWLRCETWGFCWISSSNHEDGEEDCIPRDVPKGHLVVYVGENQSRFVINVKLLKNPLFNALLDQAQEEYDFAADSRLYIPCHEDIFLSVVQCANDRQSTFCL